jgi:hypothetical protein
MIIGNISAKLAYLVYYVLDTNSYNLFVTVLNMLLFISHGNIFFINIFLNDQFNRQFRILFGLEKRRVDATIQSSNNNNHR